MKKLFVAVALVMGLGTSVAVANTVMNEVVIKLQEIVKDREECAVVRGVAKSQTT